MRIPKILFLTILWVCTGVFAQNKQLLYDFTEIPQANLINPGSQVDWPDLAVSQPMTYLR